VQCSAVQALVYLDAHPIIPLARARGRVTPFDCWPSTVESTWGADGPVDRWAEGSSASHCCC